MSKREYIYAIGEKFVESPFGVSTSLDMTITREEIIRCRDCKHSIFGGGRCRHWAYDGEDAWVEPDGFCAWAVRK